MNISTVYNKLIKEDGFIIVDANNDKYVIGKPEKENPITIRLLDKKLNFKLIFLQLVLHTCYDRRSTKHTSKKISQESRHSVSTRN